jgi:TPP-dependent pyruvate/acetoin dehydrogenase alpha subunit
MSLIYFREKQKEVKWTADELQEFERIVAETFEKGLIHGPVHLSYNNEAPLLDIFQYVHPSDWVFSTWRNHYHALLHGVPRELLWSKILEGKSIAFQSLEHHFYTSAIVNGILPIAVGTALGLKWKKSSEMVWCFVGDMAAEGGVFYEALKYSIRFELPIHFVVEDNGLSTNSLTQATWGPWNRDVIHIGIEDPVVAAKYLTRYKYAREKYPHVGIGKWIHF